MNLQISLKKIYIDYDFRQFTNLSQFLTILLKNEKNEKTLLITLKENEMNLKKYIFTLLKNSTKINEEYNDFTKNNPKDPFATYITNLENNNMPITHPKFLFFIISKLLGTNIKYSDIIEEENFFVHEKPRVITIIVHDKILNNFYEAIEKTKTT